MKNIIKAFLPPFITKIYKDIYFKILINLNKSKVTKGVQDIEIYSTDLTAEKLNSWGKESTWNEIQMFFTNRKGKVLDVACGTGINMKDIKKFNNQLEVYGCDISQKLIDLAIENRIEKKFLTCIDATQMTYEKDFFDYTYSIGSLEHFTEEGIDLLVKKLHHITKTLSIHMMPVSKKNINEGWIKTYQTFHNNSPNWWKKKFLGQFSRVEIIDSSWQDHISVGKWFVCYK